MKRISFKKPAYACGDGETCTHERRGAHGYHNEEWIYVVVRDDGRVALSLRVGSGIYAPGTPISTATHKPGEKPNGYDISTHVNFPCSREDVLQGVPGAIKNCEYVEGGSCHTTYTSALEADSFVKEHFDKAAGFEQPEAFWLALEDHLTVVTQGLEDARETWAICECCKGQGTVRKSNAAR